MKTLLLLITLALPAFADEADKEALRNLRGIYEKAIGSRDLSQLKPHLAADFTAVMITADEVTGYEGITAYWKKVEDFLGDGGTYQVTIEPDDTLFEGNLAIAKGRAKEHVVRGGKSLDFTSVWTVIARKEAGAWKIVRIQASIDPVGNPIIAVLQGAKLWLYTGAALVIGGLAGFLIARRRNA